MKISQKILLFCSWLSLIVTSLALAVTCPNPEKVSESLGGFDLSKKETSDFVDKSPGQEDDLDARQRQGNQGIKFQARPDCYSSDNFNMRGCPQNAFKEMTFSHAVLNRFRSGDNGTVWCYYKTPDGSMVSVNMDSVSGGTYRVVTPSGGGWISSGQLMFKCQGTTVDACPFDFEQGRLPDALSL